MVNSHGFSIFLALPPHFWAAFGMAPDLAHQSPESLHLGFMRQYIPIRVCLSHQQKTNSSFFGKTCSWLQPHFLCSTSQKVHIGGLPGDWRFHLTSTELRWLVPFSHPCHLQDSPKIVRRIPVGGTSFYVFPSLLFNFFTSMLGHITVFAWYADDTLLKSKN